MMTSTSAHDCLSLDDKRAHLKLVEVFQQQAALVGLGSHKIVVALVLLHEEVLHKPAQVIACAPLLQPLMDSFEVRKEDVVPSHNPAEANRYIKQDVGSVRYSL